MKWVETKLIVGGKKIRELSEHSTLEGSTVQILKSSVMKTELVVERGL